MAQSNATQARAYCFNCALFFLDTEQRNPGSLDNDGRSCAVKQTRGPFVSTTMQVQEGGDVTVTSERHQFVHQSNHTIDGDENASHRQFNVRHEINAACSLCVCVCIYFTTSICNTITTYIIM